MQSQCFAKATLTTAVLVSLQLECNCYTCTYCQTSQIVCDQGRLCMIPQSPTEQALFELSHRATCPQAVLHKSTIRCQQCHQCAVLVYPDDIFPACYVHQLLHRRSTKSLCRYNTHSKTTAVTAQMTSVNSSVAWKHCRGIKLTCSTDKASTRASVVTASPPEAVTPTTASSAPCRGDFNSVLAVAQIKIERHSGAVVLH